MDAAEPGEQSEALPTDKAELISLLQSQRRIPEVCQALRSLVDPGDDHYVVQIELASEGVISALFGCLDSEDQGQIGEICETVSALCANIDNVSVRKRSGLETGFFERSFNPVQDELIEVDGIRLKAFNEILDLCFRQLVDLFDSKTEGVREIAIQTLSTCCSFNHSNTLAYMRCLVHDVLDKKYDRLEYIHQLLSDIEVRDDDVVVLLNQLMLPVLHLVKQSSDAVKKEALGVMGSLSAKHPASAAFWCEEGALEPMTQTILEGLPLKLFRTAMGALDEHLRPIAVHAMWELVRRDKGLLHPESNLLGCSGLKLLEPLVQVIGWTQDKTDSVPEEQDEDYSDEALLLLKALAEQDDEVREKVGDTVSSDKSRCSVM